MPQRIQNPFQAQTPLGAAIANFGQSLFGSAMSPSEREKQAAETALLRARTGSAEATAAKNAALLENIQFSQGMSGRALEAQAAVSAPIAQPSAIGPFQPGVKEAAIAAAAKGAARLKGLPARMALGGIRFADTPRGMAQAIQGVTANVPGFDDAAVTRAAAGAGTFIGENQAASLAGQDRVRAANAANDIALAQAREAAKPLTLSQTQAQVFSGLPGETQATVVGPSLTKVRGGALIDTLAAARGGPSVPSDVRTAGLGAQAFGPAGESVLDEAGVLRRVPRDVALDPNRTVPLSDFARGVPPAASKFSDLTNTTKAKLEQSELALGDFNIIMDDVESIAKKSKGLFGFTGNVQRFGQAVVGQVGAFGSIFGANSFDAISTELLEAGVAPKFFDPNLTDIDKMATLAAYQGASALARQEGRGLSDKDFILFRGIIGNPKAWLSTQEAFLAGTKRLRDVATRMMKNRIHILRGGSLQTGGGQPGQPELTADELMDQSLADEDLIE